jgi:hypothetical protein
VTAYWCASAWLTDGPVDSVRVTVDDDAGTITAVETGKP